MSDQSPHWADQTARRIIGQRGDKDQYVLASGITPSGIVHIGNFREVITVDLVARALKRLGKRVRFIFSWDNFDTLRKVPKNLPEQEMLKRHLRQSIARIPDPYGKEASYAAHNIRKFESEIRLMGVDVEFLYQEEKYGSGHYADGIRQALENRDRIRAILNARRNEPLAEGWLPTSIYCERCHRDSMESETYDGQWSYSYKCAECHHAATADIKTCRNLKLNWRIDWPMRWAFERVDFEPGGKDHSSDGGSFDTGKDIVRDVYGFEPPIYVQYDFVGIKGGAGKISSSSGNTIDLTQVLSIYSPEMIRWIFARQRPNTDFAIAFDEDVIKAHDEFDRCEEQAYGHASGKSRDKWLMNRRIYELSLVEGEVAALPPKRTGFRVLCNRLQICNGDIHRTWERYYQSDIREEQDKARFCDRATRAWYWLLHYAPEEFRYRVNERKVELAVDPPLAKSLAALRELVTTLDLETIPPKELNQAIYDKAIRGSGCEASDFFKIVYQHLIGREQGPRLPGFLKEIGKQRLLELL